MNCNQSLKLMLEAEPAELTLAVESPLAAHIRECAKCSAVAARLVGVTAAIADVVRADPRLPAIAARHATRRRRAAGLSAALAAGLLAAAAVATRRDEPEVAAALATGAGATSAPATTVTRQATPQVPVVRAQQSVALRRFAGAQSYRSIPLTSERLPMPSADDVATLVRNAGPPDGLSVAPPAGVRATVMTTADASVTVVWLHPADTTRSPR